MDVVMLKDKNVLPGDEVLSSTLKASFPAFEELRQTLADSGVILEWRYYNDGKAWLCKMPLKKKNLGWISTYDGFFKIGFYFGEKHIGLISALDIAQDVKDNFLQAKPAGKLIPLVFVIKDKEPLKDVMTIVELKRNLK